MIRYFYGEDLYAARREIEAIAQKQETPIYWLDREELEQQALSERVAQGTSGLFGAQLLVVRDPSQFPKALQEDIVKAKSEKRKVQSNVILWDREAPDKRSRLWQALKKHATEFAYPNPRQVAQELMAETEKRGATLALAAAELLITRLGLDRFQLLGEIEKLSLTRGAITAGDIAAEVAAKEPEVEVFAMLDALVAGQRKAALQQVEALLTAGEGEMYVLAMLGYQFRSLYLIATGATGGLHPYVVQKNRQIARSRPAAYWLDSLVKIAATDFGIKQGKVDIRTGLLMLVLSLARANPKSEIRNPKQYQNSKF